MAAALRLETPASTDATPAADRRQWWENVQSDFSALLTEAARTDSSRRLAG